jgi:hypothetical protein
MERVECHRFPSEDYPAFITRIQEQVTQRGQDGCIIGIEGNRAFGLGETRVEFVPEEIGLRRRLMRTLVRRVRGNRPACRFQSTIQRIWARVEIVIMLI